MTLDYARTQIDRTHCYRPVYGRPWMAGGVGNRMLVTDKYLDQIDVVQLLKYLFSD